MASEQPTLTPRTQQIMLTIAEAATYLNVPDRWVADAVRERKIRHARVGKHVRFRVEWLEEFVAACEQPVTAQVLPMHHSRRHSRL